MTSSWFCIRQLSQFIISTQGTRPFGAKIENKWRNVSTNGQAFVLCIGANVLLLKAVRRTAVQDYSNDTFLSATVPVLYPFFLYLYRTLLYSRKVTDSNFGPETGHSDSCLLWLYSVLP